MAIKLERQDTEYIPINMSWVSRCLLAGDIRLVFIYNRIEQLGVVRGLGKYTYAIVGIVLVLCSGED